MKPKFQTDLDQLGPVLIYKISVTLVPTENVLHGEAQISVPNNSPHLWNHLIFRLYPMLDQYGGFMTIRSASVDERPTSFVYQPGTDKTALRVSLPKPLRPGQIEQVHLRWKLEIPKWQDLSSIYALFGESQQIISLPLFYPSLAVYDPTARFGLGEWWTENGNVRGDAAFNNISLFVVTATLPSDQIPVTSGTLITETEVNDTQTQHIWVTGPAREFLLHTSPQFGSVYTETNGTRVTSYWLPGHDAAGHAALTHAVASLRIYNDRFGEYPYRDLRIAPAPLNFRGMEYTNVSLLGVEVYFRFRNSLESLIAHEVAHQWWYQIVHNDPVNSPWLDEALAEYSIKLYVEALYGDTTASRMQASRWQNRVNQLQNRSLAIDQPVMDFYSNGAYETIIYSKGALFYDQVREILGDRQFTKFLQDYLNHYRYQIVSTSDWISATQQLDNEMVDELFREWVKNPTTVQSSQ
ncbi:M1 family metallopeptidase [Chloroflexi bacterium TSY]|nr:M1 family metallopeptidase [Chloroflexi bacterium TSY]